MEIRGLMTKVVLISEFDHHKLVAEITDKQLVGRDFSSHFRWEEMIWSLSGNSLNRLNIRPKPQLRHGHSNDLNLSRRGSVAYNPSGNLFWLGALTTRFIATLATHIPGSGKMTLLSGIPRGGPLLRAAGNYTRQRPKSVENCGDDVELKARSQPMGTCLPARSSDGCDLGRSLPGPGALLSRSPLSARSTNCGLETIPSVLGNDGKEIRTIEQSTVDTIASRVIVLRISLSHPREYTPTNEQKHSSFLPCRT
jgi:hypothetical protein